MKTLIQTNPYLKDPATRRKLIRRSVVTSCGVEGIKVSDSPSPHSAKISRYRTKRHYLDMLSRRSSK